jgi:HEAT repeat protein
MKNAPAEEIVPAIIERFKDHNETVRIYAIGSCGGTVGEPLKAAVPALKEELNDDNPEIRAAAAEALKKIEGDEATER